MADYGEEGGREPESTGGRIREVGAAGSQE